MGEWNEFGAGERAAITCPLHSAPDAWYDRGCRGCIGARLDQAERALTAANAEVWRLRSRLGAIVEIAESPINEFETPLRRLDMILRLALGNGSKADPS